MNRRATRDALRLRRRIKWPINQERAHNAATVDLDRYPEQQRPQTRLVSYEHLHNA